MIINKQPEVDAQGMVSSITPGYPDLPFSSHNQAGGRWGLPLCSLYTSFYFCGGSVSSGHGRGHGRHIRQWICTYALREVQTHKRVIEDARTLSPPLIKLSSTFSVDLFPRSEYHFLISFLFFGHRAHSVLLWFGACLCL